MEYENEMIKSEGEEEEGCKTPIRDENQIRLNLKCPPPPPKKNKPHGAKREAPKDGYYQPPDLELLFITPPLLSS
ncbi:hypothetical protein MKX01_017892 [Papaver californicum]|nr:hypothetical protein MKX01_017892 [Papaver californicum]